MTTEIEIPLPTLPVRRPCVSGVALGQIVTGRLGRKFSVLRNDEWVIGCASDGDENTTATGPYSLLQALDDKNCRVIWPRSWYSIPGEQIDIFWEDK